MKLSVLVSTLDAGIDRVGAVLLEPLRDVTYFISHQVTAAAYRVIPPELQREDVSVTQIEGRGMSRNRNSTLKMADGDIALLADDDVRYKPQYFQTVIEAFYADPQLDVACFKIATHPGEPEYKDYFPQPYSLNNESHHYISSIEIAVRLSSIRKKGITFNEHFGLGSPFVQFGEEAVFIFDCIRSGLNVKYIPEYAVEHSATSAATKQPEFGEVRVIFKGAYDAHRYGWKALPAAFLDALSLKRKLKASGKSSLLYLRERLRGVSYILHK
jgi:glycosyltransferase involved in cell wall biosynthesis